MDKEIIFKNRKDYEQRIGDYTGEIECHEEKMKEFYKKEFIKYEKIFSKLDCHLEYSFSEWKSKCCTTLQLFHKKISYRTF